MTLNIPAAREHMRALWEDAGERAASGERSAPYDEGMEARISFVAETYDEETGRARPLGPRKDRP